MTWNWQKPDWLQFSSDSKLLRKAAEEFLFSSGVIVGTVQHLTAGDRDQLTVEAGFSGHSR